MEPTLSPAATFIRDANQFDDLYLLKASEKEVRAVKEVLPRKGSESPQQAIIAHYQSFTTPVCVFANSTFLPVGTFDVQLLQPDTVNCVTEGDLQKVEVLASPGKKEAMNWLWPQLTGKLRVE